MKLREKKKRTQEDIDKARQRQQTSYKAFEEHGMSCYLQHCLTCGEVVSEEDLVKCKDCGAWGCVPGCGKGFCECVYCWCDNCSDYWVCKNCIPAYQLAHGEEEGAHELVCNCAKNVHFCRGLGL